MCDVITMCVLSGLQSLLCCSLIHLRIYCRSSFKV